MAMRAYTRAPPRGASAAVACRACLLPPDLDFLIDAEDCVFKFNDQVESKVVASLLARMAATALARPAHSEHLAEQVAKDVADVYAARKRACAKSASAQPRVPVPIVGRALFGIAQHLVGFAHLLEFFFGRVIAWIPVRVMLERLLAIGTLQLLIARVARDTQDLVKIRFAHSSIRTHFV